METCSDYGELIQCILPGMSDASLEEGREKGTRKLLPSSQRVALATTAQGFPFSLSSLFSHLLLALIYPFQLAQQKVDIGKRIATCTLPPYTASFINDDGGVELYLLEVIIRREPAGIFMGVI